MAAKVYIETTIPSYLASRPSCDVVTAAHQQITHEWWERDRELFDLYISQFVLDECGDGNTAMAKARLELLSEIAVLEISDAGVELSKQLVDRGPLPAKAEKDPLHIAIAAANAMDYLLTWNMKHIANAFMKRSIDQKCRDAGFEPPVICTPEELLGEDYYVEG